jgi:hypothetical protein
MRTLSLLVLASMLTATSVSAQVKLDIKLLPDNKTYVVSALAEQSWPSPMNRVGSVQVVLRHDSDKSFQPNITSLVSGVTWMDNASVEHPASPGKTYVCIALVQSGSAAFNFQNGVSQALFTFENTAPNCAGTIELVSNDDAEVVAVRQGGFNVTQNMAVLGAHGNAVTGFVNNSVQCLAAVEGEEPSFKDLSAYPNPAYDRLFLNWSNTTPVAADAKATIVTYNLMGIEIDRFETSAQPTEGGFEVPVLSYPNGAYYTRLFIGDQLHSKTVGFLVVR